MKGHIKFLLFPIMILAFLPYNSNAQLPDTLQIEFDFEGLGNMVMDSPPIYMTDIIAGDPLVLGGTWWFEIDDSDWPDPGDPDTRWNYILDNYFTYNGAPTYNWTAVFSDANLPQKPIWELSHPINGTMGGTLVLAMTFPDWDQNGVMDPLDRMYGMISGTMIVMKYGTGLFSTHCGIGAYNGTLTNADPLAHADDFIEGHCLLDLINCSIGTSEKSWSALKKLYR